MRDSDSWWMHGPHPSTIYIFSIDFKHFRRPNNGRCYLKNVPKKIQMWFPEAYDGYCSATIDGRDPANHPVFYETRRKLHSMKLTYPLKIGHPKRKWSMKWSYSNHPSGQIIATSHDLGPQKVAKEGKSPYFRKIQVGEILFHLARSIFRCFSSLFVSGRLWDFNYQPSPGGPWSPQKLVASLDLLRIHKKKSKNQSLGTSGFGEISQKKGDSLDLHPKKKLTWKLKWMVSNRDLLFQWSIFRCHVSFLGCMDMILFYPFVIDIVISWYDFAVCNGIAPRISSHTVDKKTCRSCDD